MVVNKRTKRSRSRGLHTHFYGSKKKHRGAGHRGGRGNAGSGKKADQKKPSIWKDTKYFGAHGFASKSRVETESIALKDIARLLPQWITQGTATRDGASTSLDLSSVGFNKVLSNGNAPANLKLTAQFATKGAIEKIEAAGGSVEGLSPKKEKKPKKDAQAPASKNGKDGKGADAADEGA
jgi:large subunit ribosomal protein L15